MSPRHLVLCAAVALLGCFTPGAENDGGGGGAGGGTAGGSGGGSSGGAGGGSGDAGVVCQSCAGSSECGAQGACVQVGGTDGCLLKCAGTTCGAGETCVPAVASDGTQVQVCVPAGACGVSCPASCPAGSRCDVLEGQCVSANDGGTDAGVCAGFVGPAAASCCTACTPGSSGCQANGCYGGWNCETSSCRCRAPGTPCPVGVDGGLEDGGVAGTVTWDGGTVERLYFAVVGDTRPALPDDTANYPTQTITGIFDAMEAMVPRPQFVVGTGDYVFASPFGQQGAAQLDLYLGAKSHFSGPLFPSMGNHECTGTTATNCASGLAANSTILAAYLTKFMQPMGKTLTYYAFDINGPGNAWTSKFIVPSCNVWDATQKAWVQAQLARPTTYTFMVRHIPLGVNSPCTSDLDPLSRGTNVTMVLVGHTHTFSHSGNQLIEGVGGAPISGNATYGYATIEQLSSGSMRVTQWDSATRQAVATYTVP